jgi:hypothetical protein
MENERNRNKAAEQRCVDPELVRHHVEELQQNDTTEGKKARRGRGNGRGGKLKR